MNVDIALLNLSGGSRMRMKFTVRDNFPKRKACSWMENDLLLVFADE